MAKWEQQFHINVFAQQATKWLTKIEEFPPETN
jgi:hypothetical protein